MNVAQQVRLAKEKYPDDFCPVKGCLWRVRTARGYRPCQKHERSEAAKANGARQSAVPGGERGEQGAPASCSTPNWNCHDPKCTHPNCRLAF